ncbi:ABC transporter ATP-binding protein [Gemella sp. 19428wG2_WT2a]|nr:ABC transporter ATP-binding protein [Gemella sp. 19428wG2_WT2a]TFU60050.1 ABC transporter ATP-binding protein [Gemella sp. WT2a]
MNIIEVNQLEKTYKNGFKAVDNINIKIEKGKIYGLLGPNGAGKSTLISIIVGLIRKTSGEVFAFNEPISNFNKISQKIGYVPQEIAIYPDLTVLENVMFFGALYGIDRKSLKDKAMESLKLVGLLENSKEYPKNFSGGMQRRLNIACALVHSPELIIFDEPTVGIDPHSRNNILESIMYLNKSGATIIYTSHYMEEVEKICDYVYILDKGKVIEQGTILNLYQRYTKILDSPIMVSITEESNLPDEIFKYCRLDIAEGSRVLIFNETSFKKIIEVLYSHSIEVNDIKKSNLNLEEIFLFLTGKTLRD